ncbi:Stk1 family PASTA domain-containing Ser/Thr kinase [Wukongibacter sp. M2B1]|uniref:Stk1 family PASTA domain-containing Ser/Thr kinase n=1 Tax=Wukongibacter sp. M2B1 TaxID=3088895 RepID=UPI003D796931
MIGKILGERYEILEKIGGGGMALVYKAKCRLLNRFVAVKILRPEFISDEDFINKFEKESQAAASLSHPNIVNIYDVGTDNDTHYIVMEYVDGKTLKKYIKEKGFLSNDEVIKISKQIALALQHAHDNHIVHRDIKPHNILITEDGRAKVTDFGIARAITSSTITNTGSVIGSVHYFSPEQARGGFVDEKSDIYSLGVTMFEMTTGRVPFSGNTPVTVALKHLKEEVVPPSMINPDITNGLENIILKSMHKDKNKRYDSAIMLYNDLEESLNNPEHSVAILDDDESPTRVIPAINDLDVFEEEPKEKKRSSKITIAIGIVSALIISSMVVVGAFYNVFKDKFGVQEVQVPNITNKSQDVAKNDLEGLGLNVMVENELHDSEIPLGYVISQDPDPGINVKEEYTVRLTVSLGPKKADIPNITHKDIDEGKILLENNGLEVGNIEYVYNDLPIGIIISQVPEAGGQIEEGSSVDVVVSQGSKIETVIMPNLLGKNINDVKDAAKKLELILSKISYEFSEDVEKDSVISQTISPGTEIKQNSVFNVVVSKGSENIEQPTEGEKSEQITKQYRILLNFDKEEEKVKVVKTENGISTVLHEAVHDKDEEELRLNVSGKGMVKVDVYFGNELIQSVEREFK